MKIYVDADAFPGILREWLFKAAERRNVSLVMVAGKPVRTPPNALLSSISVPGGVDAADDKIAELSAAGDLVITADIPLAGRVIAKGAFAINPRGELYTEQNIQERLATRNLMEQLRNEGVVSGGPAPFGPKDRQNFINQVDRLLTRLCR